MRILTQFMLAVPLVLLLGSHFGAFHPLGDALAVFRGPMALIGGLIVVVFAMLRAKLAGFVAAGLVIWSAVTVLGPRGGQAAQHKCALCAVPKEYAVQYAQHRTVAGRPAATGP